MTSPLALPDPFAALTGQSGALALVVGTEGPSYRPIGAAMAILADGHRVGTLSSGCIEADIASHALAALDSGKATTLRYGRGSPFMDLRLPCGGGLDIAIIPHPDQHVLTGLAQARAARRQVTLAADPGTGRLALNGPAQAMQAPFTVTYPPDPRFVVMGKGPEAAAFASLAHAVGYPALLISPDAQTRQAASCDTLPLVHAHLPPQAAIDAWTAIALFFHDHEWEPPILRDALATDAFYIGAQGSMRAAAARREALADLGISPAQMDRVHGPVGLIASAREARVLAVSVLAQALALVPA